MAATLAATAPAVAERTPIPPPTGADLVRAKCKDCHGLELVTNSAGISPAAWKQVMQEMEDLGLSLARNDRETIICYLTTCLGPDPAPAGTSGDSKCGATACTSRPGKKGRDAPDSSAPDDDARK
ncbi:MAG: hypothetical protein GY953_14675 [bacterium]|nr:hypothetical protein [bacterium]